MNRRLARTLAPVPLLVAAGWWLAADGNRTNAPAVPAAQPAPSASLPAPAPEEIPPLRRVLAAMSGPSSPGEAEFAIGWLDTRAREGPALSRADRASLLETLAAGPPAGTPVGLRAHLFNSACNALAAGGAPPCPEYLTILENQTRAGPRVLRLYALQHLGHRYPACDESARARIRALVDSILAETPVSPVAGTALALAARWNGPGTARENAAILRSALALAADATQPVDIRVTALQTAGEDPAVLPAARALAADTSQHAILRKAALWLIGRHGGEPDTALLRQCAAESPRLAQAATPAAGELAARLERAPRPVLIPFPVPTDHPPP